MATILPITNQCNQNCLFCSAERRNDQVGRKVFQRAINRAKDGLIISGGEPTLSPDLFWVIKEAKKKNLFIELQTNGRRFIYDDFREKCLAFKRIDFIIPLHGYDVKSHDQITQVSGSFYQTIEGLKKLLQERKTDQKIEIRIVATRLNLKIIPEIIKLIKDKFPAVDRVVLIFLEFEGMAKINKEKVGITYQEIKPILWQIKKYFKLFKDFRLYHFPLCVLEPDFWPYAWRTLPEEEITYLPECQKCLLKKYCLGIHKSYLNFVKKPEIQPRLNLKGIEIKKTGNFYKPIKSIKIDRALNNLYSLTSLANFLINQKTEPTKYSSTPMFFRFNKLKQYTAFDIRQWWVKAVKEIKKGKRLNLLNFCIRIPFCESRCNYCMFPSIVFPNNRILDIYLKQISEEMAFYKDAFSGIEFRNIYVGGGSPSILAEKRLTWFLTSLFKNFSFYKNGERTFECNPYSTTLKKLRIIKKMGFNRISFGVESLDPDILAHVNRAYQDYESVKEAINNALFLGFNVNVDLMIGFKKDNPRLVKESFRKIIELKPTNISLYPLKPCVTYLEKYFNNKEEVFYSLLKNKINQALRLIKPIAKKFHYTFPYAFNLNEADCVNFSQKNGKNDAHYYDTELPYSVFGIGYCTVSKIIGIGRYNNKLLIEDKFNPLKYCYEGHHCQLKDDMRDYILQHLARGKSISQKEFKKIFNRNLIDSFPYAFSVLKKLKKIKIGEDSIYFLIKGLKEIFIYELFFWGKNKFSEKFVFDQLDNKNA